MKKKLNIGRLTLSMMYESGACNYENSNNSYLHKTRKRHKY